ncbi:hypothetical protein ISCGN_011423 [Ixodes scapularis]
MDAISDHINSNGQQEDGRPLLHPPQLVLQEISGTVSDENIPSKRIRTADVERDQGEDNTSLYSLRDITDETDNDEPYTVVTYRKNRATGIPVVFKPTTPNTSFWRVNPNVLANEIIAVTQEKIVSHKINKEGNLSVNVSSLDSANKLLAVTSLGEIQVTAHIPEAYSRNYGKVKHVPLEYSNDELLDYLKDFGVTSVQRQVAYRRQDDGIVEQHPSTTVVLTFRTDRAMPQRIYLGFTSHPVEEYFGQAVQCFNCQRYGHLARNCRGERRCKSTGLRRRIVAAGAAPRIRRTATTRAEKKSSKFPELGGVFHGEARTTEILPAGTAAQDNEEWVHGSDTIVPDCPDWLRVFLSGSHRSLQDGRGEASSQGGVATGLGIHGNGDQGDSSGRSSAVIDQRGVEQEMELIRAKEKLVRLELELERLRVENRPRSSASGAELSLREEVLSFSRLMKGVLTQMPSSELLVPSWFDGVENVFQTYEVPERLRGSLIRPYFTERMRALVNRLPVGEASEYGAVKERVLLELKMSPAEYRRLFLNATRAERESWTQFVTRVESCVEYYARSRSVESLEDLLALIVSDRVRDSMPVDMQEEKSTADVTVQVRRTSGVRGGALRGARQVSSSMHELHTPLIRQNAIAQGSRREPTRRFSWRPTAADATNHRGHSDAVRLSRDP